MTPLQHIVEPERLYLTWQPLDEGAPTRTRRVVGVVMKRAGSTMGFRYLTELADYQKAKEAGFQGFPAFKANDVEQTHGVRESFLRRLPPRNREDFADYLALHRLPSPFEYSDFALLGYTRSRLPSDGFELVPWFPATAVPIDLIVEVVGVRHVNGSDVGHIKIGDDVTFKIDADNPVDQDAVAVFLKGKRLGYVNRAMRSLFSDWLRVNSVSAQVERINGKPERPVVYLRVAVRQACPQ